MNRAIESQVREETFCGCLKPMVFSLMLAMGTAAIAEPVHASEIRADKSAPKNQQPTVLNTANGLPQVNIQTPSAAGVSVNQYRQFDVDGKGAILNNSRKSVQTQTAGWIQGNPWLAGGEARVIVNQVNSANPSLLNGYIEVGGRRAEVVLANPAGIQVNGGGFINANKVDLVGAVPFIRNGQLEGFGAYSGKVGIAGQGLDVRDADYTRILADAVQADGGIWAKDLQVEGTAAIDTGKLGGMYADKITLISHGSDVRNAGQVFAAAGGVSISADGKLANSGTIAASGTAAGLRVKSGALANSGTLSAQGDAELDSGALSNSGTVLSTAQLSVRSNRADNSGRIQAVRLAVESGDLHNSGRISQTGLQGLSLESNGLDNRGKIGYPEAETTAAPSGGAAAGGSNTPDAPSTAFGGSSSVATTTVLPHYEAGYIKSAALENSGKIEANGGIDLNSPNGLSNAGELQLNRLTVAGEALDNRKGRIQAQSIEVRTRHTDNRAGDLTAAKNLSLHNDELDNRGGKLLSAEALSVDAKQLNNSEKGQIAANGAAVLKADMLNNQGGSIDAEALALASGSLNNQRGAIRSNQKSELTLSQSLDNRQGQITSAGQLHIRSERTDNSGGTVAADGDVSLQGGSLRNQGTLAAGRDLGIDLKEGFTVEQDIRAGRGLTLASGGRLTNAHSLEAAAGLRLQAAEIDNQTAGKIQAGNRVEVEALGDVRNRGLLNSNGLTKVKAGKTLDNAGTGRIYGDDVALEADAVVNREEGGKAAVVAARQRLDIGAKRITNQEAAVLSSEGSLHVGGALDKDNHAEGMANGLINGSAEIRSAGDMVLRTRNLANRNLHFKTVEREIDGSRKRITEYQPNNETTRYDSSNVTGWGSYDTVYLDGHGFEDYTRYQYNRHETKHAVTESAPAVISAGGHLVLDGLNLQNDKSHILANGIDIVQKDVQQIDGEGEHRVRVTNGTKQYHEVIYTRLRKRSEWKAEQGYRPADIVTPIKLGVWVYDDNHQGVVETHAAESTSAVSVAGVHHEKFPSIRSLQSEIKLPTSSLYTVNPSRSGWLIETDPAFANYRQWLGSDYMLGRLGLDGDHRHKRLGDGYYEQKLINEQIARLTGYRRLDGYQNDEEQFKALMDSGLTAARSMNLVPGIALSTEQVAQLTSDIVWLENQTVTLPDGSTQTVLVPKVYVVVRKGDLKPTGALITANDLRLNASGTLTNSGTLNARRVMVLDAENIRHLNGSASAGSLTVRAEKNMDVQGGTFTARDYLDVHANGTLNLTANSVTSEKNSTDSQSRHTNLGRIAGLYVTGANGTLALSARDLNMQAAQIDNQGTGNTIILAENSLNIGTLQTGYRHSHTQDEHNYQIEGATQAIGSNINGKGNVLIQSNGTALIQGSKLNSESGLLAVKAKDLNITAAQNSSEFASSHRHSSKRIFGKSTETNRHTDNRTEAVSSVLTGKQVLLQSNGDMRITGSHVVSDELTRLAAKGQIKVDAAQNTRQSSTLSQKDRSGISLDDGSLLFGKYKKGEADTQGEVSHTVSTIGSVNGRLDIEADGNIDLSGADLIAAKGGSIIGNNIRDHAVIDTVDSEMTRFKESNGLFIGAKSNVADAIANIQNSGNRAVHSDNPRLKALYTAKTAYAVKDLAAIAEATKGRGNGTAKGAEGKITVGIGTRRSQSHDRAHSETVRKTTVASQKGSEFVLQAHGKQTPAEGDLLLEGVDFNTGDLVLDAKRDIKIGSTQAQQKQESESRSMSAEVGVYAAGQLNGNGASGGIGIYGKGSYSKSGSTLENLSHEESTINADKLTLRSGRHTHLEGALVDVERIEGNIAGNLTLSSQQDIDRYRQKSISGELEGRYAIYGSDSGVQGSLSYSDSKSDYKGVQERTRMHAGKGGLDLYVGGHTQLDGAAITSDADPSLNRLSTQTLGHSNLENKAAYQTRGGSISFNTNGGGNPMEVLGNMAAVPGLAMPVGDEKSSVTRSVLAEGNIEIRSDAQGSSLNGLSRGSDEHKPLERIFDLQKVQQRQEMAQLIGEVGFRAAGDVAGAMGWKEGSPERLALHGLVGALQAKAAGADIKGAAAGTMATSWLNTQVSEYLRENSHLNDNQRKAVQQWLAVMGGAAVGGLVGGGNGAWSGGSAARDAEVFNRQLHPDERKWIKNNAKEFAKQLNGGNEPTSEQIAAAEKRLAQQASKNTDLLWRLALDKNVDQKAQEFLHASSQTFKNEFGKQQKYFTTQGKDFTRPELYATDAKTDMEFYKRNLHSQYNSSIPKGVKELTQKIANEKKDDWKRDPVLESLKLFAPVGKAIFNAPEAAASCLSNIGDCSKSGVAYVNELGTSIGEGLASIHEGDLKPVYGQNVDGSQKFLLGLKGVEALTAASGASKVLGTIGSEVRVAYMIHNPKVKKVPVVTWAGKSTPDFSPGRWVQIGEPNRWNFFKTGLVGPKIDPKVKSQFPFFELNYRSPTAKFSNHRTMMIEKSKLQRPDKRWEAWLKPGQRRIRSDHEQKSKK